MKKTAQLFCKSNFLFGFANLKSSAAKTKAELTFSIQVSHEFPAFKTSFHLLPSAFHSNSPGGREKIDDGTSGESVPSSISSDFLKFLERVTN